MTDGRARVGMNGGTLLMHQMQAHLKWVKVCKPAGAYQDQLAVQKA